MTSSSNDNLQKEPAPPPCPICSSAGKQDYAPFCSKRCADVDLHRWLSGGYAIPAAEDDSNGASETPPE